MEWNCREASDLVTFDHSTANGVVSISVTLPTCSNLIFLTDRFDNDIENGRLSRNEISYELPETYPIKTQTTDWWQPSRFFLGRRMIVHIRPNGPARFIVEHGGPNGIAWFDSDRP